MKSHRPPDADEARKKDSGGAYGRPETPET